MRTLLIICVFGLPALSGQAVDPGRRLFETRCGTCHGGDGNGGEMGPGILFRLPARDDQQLISLVREGLPERPLTAMREQELRIDRERWDGLMAEFA